MHFWIECWDWVQSESLSLTSPGSSGRSKMWMISPSLASPASSWAAIAWILQFTLELPKKNTKLDYFFRGIFHVSLTSFFGVLAHTVSKWVALGPHSRSCNAPIDRPISAIACLCGFSIPLRTKTTPWSKRINGL